MFCGLCKAAGPGLNFKIPFLEQIYKKVSIQNRSVELEFQAVTVDQANVYFKSMLLYSVQNENEDTIRKVAFKFISDKDLMQALIREGGFCTQQPRRDGDLPRLPMSLPLSLIFSFL